MCYSFLIDYHTLWNFRLSIFGDSYCIHLMKPIYCHVRLLYSLIQEYLLVCEKKAMLYMVLKPIP